MDVASAFGLAHGVHSAEWVCWITVNSACFLYDPSDVHRARRVEALRRLNRKGMQWHTPRTPGRKHVMELALCHRVWYSLLFLQASFLSVVSDGAGWFEGSGMDIVTWAGITHTCTCTHTHTHTRKNRTHTPQTEEED